MGHPPGVLQAGSDAVFRRDSWGVMYALLTVFRLWQFVKYITIDNRRFIAEEAELAVKHGD